MHDQPLVTIGVPVYNGAAMLPDMLESLAGQTFEGFRVVICDNASADATPEIARSFAERDPRFVYHRNAENIGAAPNYNRVFELDHATPFYKWAPHDDLYAPTYLERCVELLTADPGTVLAYTIVDLVDETGEGRALDHASYANGVQASFRDEQGRQGWTMGPWHLAEGDDPAERLDELLNHMIGCFPVLGVIRTDALLRSSMHQSYYGSDRALLAELVLMGRFRQVPERLYTNRYHKTASRDLSAKARSVWIDSKGGNVNPVLQQARDILRAPAVAGLGFADQASAITVAVRHLTKRRLRALFGRTARPGSDAPASGSATV